MSEHPLGRMSRLRGRLRRHRLRAAVVGIAIVGIVAAAVIVFPLSGLFHATQLNVSITDLPAGHRGDVTVTGASGHARHLTSSTLLSVSPGEYTVSSKPVIVGRDRYFTTASSLSVQVRAGATAATVMDYYDIVPPTTVALAPQVIPTIEAATATSLTLSTPSTGVASGDVLFVPSTPTTPDGLLVKVTSVQSASGVTTLTTTPATLPEALPQGSIDTSIDLATSQVETTALRRSAQSGVQLDSANPLLAFNWAPDYTLNELQQMGCVGADSPATLDIQPSVAFSVQPMLHFDASWHTQWGWPPVVVSATAYVTLTENFTAGVTTTGEFSCTLPFTSPALSLIHIPLDVAGLPVVITPEVSWLASASANIVAAAQFGVSQSATATGGISFSTQSGFQLLDSLNNTWNVDSSASVTGSATLSMGPQLVFDVDGQGGPSLTLTASLTAKAKTSPPSATLSGEITGQAGLDLHIFGVINVEKNATVFDVGKDLWHTTPQPSAMETATPSPTAPSVSALRWVELTSDPYPMPPATTSDNLGSVQLVAFEGPQNGLALLSVGGDPDNLETFSYNGSAWTDTGQALAPVSGSETPEDGGYACGQGGCDINATSLVSEGDGHYLALAAQYGDATGSAAVAEWANGSWGSWSDNAAAPFNQPLLAFDNQSGSLLVTDNNGDVWTWTTGDGWHETGTTGNSAVASSAMYSATAFDPSEGSAVSLSNAGSQSCIGNPAVPTTALVTWSNSSEGLIDPPSQLGTALPGAAVFDPTGRVVFFLVAANSCGDNPGESGLWIWDGSSLVQAAAGAPPGFALNLGLANMALYYDSSLGAVVATDPASGTAYALEVPIS